MTKAATHPDAYAFQGSSASTSAITAGAINAAGQPTKRFVKDLIRVGKFNGGGGQHQSFEVTLGDHDPANGKFSLAHFRDQFIAMRLAGIDVPTPNGHTTDAEANRGYVRDMFIEGDKLWAVIEAIGDDAIQLMSRAKVSINVLTQLNGGNGKTYDYPIDHVAIVTNPVIPDQQGFAAIAASHDTPGKGRALVLAPEQTMDTPANTPAPTDKPEDKKVTDLPSLATAMGLQVEEGQDVGQAIMAAYTAIKTERDGLKEKLADAENKPAESDVMVAASLDANTASILVENAELKLSRLVENGNITPAVRDALQLALVGTASKPNALSLSVGKQGQPSMLSCVAEILGKNDPVALKEKTKSQSAVTLSRKADDAHPDLTKNMIGAGAGESGPAL